MEWIELGNPYPLPTPKVYKPIDWPAETVTSLPLSLVAPTKPFGTVAADRRTRRSFSALDLSSLSALLSLTCRVQQRGGAELGFELTRRPTPSAGAIHPIHLILSGPGLEDWHRYDPSHHLLRKVPTTVDASEVRRDMEKIITADDATLLLFAAEPGMTAAKYGDAFSLVWRDAGVLLGCLSLAAEALDLSFCALGVTGEPWVSRLLDQPGLVGVGAAFLGARPR
jgi:SagB-type dehydrogenase family enzyme